MCCSELLLLLMMGVVVHEAQRTTSSVSTIANNMLPENLQHIVHMLSALYVVVICVITAVLMHKGKTLTLTYLGTSACHS
jgi:hypothetical protein